MDLFKQLCSIKHKRNTSGFRKLQSRGKIFNIYIDWFKREERPPPMEDKRQPYPFHPPIHITYIIFTPYWVSYQSLCPTKVSPYLFFQYHVSCIMYHVWMIKDELYKMIIMYIYGFQLCVCLKRFVSIIILYCFSNIIDVCYFWYTTHIHRRILTP